MLASRTTARAAVPSEGRRRDMTKLTNPSWVLPRHIGIGESSQTELTQLSATAAVELLEGCPSDL